MNNSRQYKAVIFDWDGTLMDSIARIVSSMQLAAIKVGIEAPSDEQVKSIIGLSLLPAAKALFGEIEPEVLQAAAKEYSHQYINENKTPVDMFAGAIELLNELKQQGLLLAVATGKSREGLERVFESSNSKHFFASSRCAGECESKPHPEMLMQIMAELDLTIEECVYIGDSIYDMQMAQNIDMDRIGVTIGCANKDDLLKHQPLAVFDCLYSLKDFLLKKA
jgi:phosphoglycolate phosphatase